MGYKLLIVDDEAIICNGLKKFVNWEDLGFLEVFTAHSVAQALVLLEQQPIDVVMTDIRMPIQTGLDLLRILNTDYTWIKTIVLSGYSDFEYAREAFRLGALDFITKPVNFAELKACFAKLLTLLKQENTLILDQKHYTKLERDTLLNNLVLGDLSALSSSRFHSLGLSNEEDFFLLRIFLDLPTKYYDALHQLKNHLSPPLLTTLNHYGIAYLFNNALTELACLFYPQKMMSLEKLFTHIEETIHPLCNVPFTVGVSHIYTHLNHFRTAYLEAGKALQYRIMKPTPFIRYQEIENILSYKDVLVDEYKTQLIEYLNTENHSALDILIDSLLENTTYTSSNQVYSIAIDLILFLQDYIKHLHEDLIDPLTLRQTIRQVLILPSPEEVCQFIKSYMSELIILMSTQSCSYGNLIQTALLYIEEHYSENITLLTLADVLYLHPTYLSRLFKDKTGKNFLKYLTDLRIEKSKLLLTDCSLKIYDISTMVGYDSSKYFSKIFKSTIGMTPHEYRDSLSIH